MINTLIIGASGYTGAELAFYLSRHPKINLCAVIISKNSVDIGKPISDIHPKLKNIVDLPLQAINDPKKWTNNIDLVFLATAHEVSHYIAPIFLSAGCVVIDLSGAYRVNDKNFYTKYYGFNHKYLDWLNKAVYGLAEWQESKIKTAQLISVPGCYPTASQLALKPLIKNNLLNTDYKPVINAISGVSGAGRKTSINNSFCEVSLHPYGVFTHRHQPEISMHLGIPVIFIPHIGNFARGILVTITCRVKIGIKHKIISSSYCKAYFNKPLVRVYKKEFPSLKSVINTPFCDIGFKIQDEYLIVVSAEDNLLKGAAAQAIQCANIRFGYEQTQALL